MTIERAEIALAAEAVKRGWTVLGIKKSNVDVACVTAIKGSRMSSFILSGMAVRRAASEEELHQLVLRDFSNVMRGPSQEETILTEST